MNVTSTFGFKFHHALGTYCMMVLWMDKTCDSRIPQYAHHYVSVAGICVSEDGERVLLVKPRRGKKNLWKFPGGFIEK